MDVLFFATLLDGGTLATFDGCTLSTIERGATLFGGDCFLLNDHFLWWRIVTKIIVE